MDVADAASVEAGVATLLSRTDGTLGALVNNAGFGQAGAIEDLSRDAMRYQFEVNLFGLARLTQLLLPAMRERRSGRIINISSMGGRVYTPLGSWYHASKHALEGWSDCLRLELGPFGIDVVIIEPGVISTEFGEVMVTPLLQRSGSGAYAPMAQAMAAATRSSYASGGGSDPQVISALILHAVRARRPKTRYIAGKYARPMLFIRKWFGDRLFDKLVLSTVK